MNFTDYSKVGSSISEGWTVISGENITKNYTLSSDYIFKNGDEIEISRYLPDDLDGVDSIEFLSQNIGVRLYIDEEEIYEFGNSLNILDSAPGDYVNLVKLPEHSEGKKITIKIKAETNMSSVMIDDVYVVDGIKWLKLYEKSKIFGSSVCLFMLIIAIVSFVCELIIFRKVYKSPCLIYISTFIIFFSLWSLTQLRILPILFGSSEYHSSLAHIYLSFLPITSFLYVMERFDIRKKTISKVAVLILHSAFVAVHVFNFTGVWKYADNVIITQGLLILVAVTMVGIFIKYKDNIKDESVRKLIVKGVCIVFVLGIFDLINIYLKKMDDYSFFSRFGMMILTVCVFVDVMKSTLNIIQLGEVSEINKKNAFTDELTGLGNRRSFNYMIDNIRELPTDKQEYGIIMFDVNYLKYFNDTYGHEMGDKLLIESARILDRSCMDEGFAFRYGGDEFAILILENATNCIERVIEKFKNNVKEANERLKWDKEISIAYGYMVSDEESEFSVDDVIKQADMKMYIKKKEMKEKE